MIRVVTINHSHWHRPAILAWLALLAILALALLVALAVYLPLLALVVAMAGALGALVSARALAQSRARAARRRSARASSDAIQPAVQLVTADGRVYTARPVPLPHTSDHTLLLTATGFVVADAEGRVIYTLRP